MKAVEFKGSNTIYGANKEGVRPLPAHRAKDNEGTATFCFELSEEEKAEIQRTGKIWLQVWTFDRPLEPLLPLAFAPVIPEAT